MIHYLRFQLKTNWHYVKLSNRCIIHARRIEIGDVGLPTRRDQAFDFLEISVVSHCCSSPWIPLIQSKGRMLNKILFWLIFTFHTIIGCSHVKNQWGVCKNQRKEEGEGLNYRNCLTFCLLAEPNPLEKSNDYVERRYTWFPG